MPFTDIEKQSLLSQKGIGPTILKRLTEMGLDDVAMLATTSPDFILQRGAEITGQLAGVIVRKRVKRLKQR